MALLYGRRGFGDHQHDVILVDATAPNPLQSDNFRYFVWRHYGIDSQRYSWNPEYNGYFDIAQPIFAALKAVGVDRGSRSQPEIYRGPRVAGYAGRVCGPDGGTRSVAKQSSMPTRPQPRGGWSKSTTATIRSFYNTLVKAREWQRDLDSIFGNQDDLFKHLIVKLATRCDNIFAVGDLVVDELRFLGGELGIANIDLVYNGIPAVETSVSAKLASKRRMQEYCEALLGYVPDYVFTHVTRMVRSKALWRDIRVMEHIDPMLREHGRRAVLFVLSTSAPAGRRPEWVAAVGGAVRLARRPPGRQRRSDR